MIHLTILGRPLGKQRHQTAIRGKGENAFLQEYTPTQTVNAEVLVKLAFMEKYPNHQPWERDVPLASIIEAFYPVPMSFSASKRKDALAGILRPCIKIDLDNCEKLVWDALNQIAYADDCAIVKSMGDKFYSEKPRVDIKIMTLDEWYTHGL